MTTFDAVMQAESIEKGDELGERNVRVGLSAQYLPERLFMSQAFSIAQSWLRAVHSKDSVSSSCCYKLRPITYIMSFEERVALVTGASQGIGKACAIALADAGCKAVVLAARNVDKLNEVAAEIAARGHQAHVVTMDLADAATITAAFSNIKEKY